MSTAMRVGVFAGIAIAAAVAMVYLRRPPAPPAAVYPDRIDLGEQPFGSIALSRFQLGNSGGSDLLVEDIVTSCSCAGVETEIGGEARRLSSLRVAPGQAADLAVRVAVGARAGTSQTIYVAFRTNDPQRPSGEIVLRIPRVRGGVHAEPGVVAFGEVPAGDRRPRTVMLYDNNLPGCVPVSARSLDPSRFTAALVPPPPGQPVARHESAGGHVASVVITPRADAGPLSGQVEIAFADAGRPPDRIDVIGEVVGPVQCRPDGLVLPRYVGGKPFFEGAVEVTARDGRAVRAAVESTPAGLTVTLKQENSGGVVATVRSAAGSAGGAVRLRVRPDGGDEVSVVIPVTVTQGG